MRRETLAEARPPSCFMPWARLSNRTEADVWRCIVQEGGETAPLCFAQERPVVECKSALIVVEDACMTLQPRRAHARALGRNPLSRTLKSQARMPRVMLAETWASRRIGSQARLIAHQGAASMEHKKQEGYF